MSSDESADDSIAIVFNNEGVVTERRSKDDLSSVRITHCGTVRLVLHRCRIGVIFIDGVDRLELTIFECSVDRIDVRKINNNPENAASSAESIISINGGTAGEIHLEQSNLLALTMKPTTVTGATFIRSVAFTDPDYVTIVGVTFEGPFYCQLEAASTRKRQAHDYIIDIRQNTFSSIAKVNVMLDGSCSGDSVATMRGSRFSDGLRLTASLDAGTLDMTGIGVTGRSELEADGSGALVLLRSALLDGRVNFRLDEINLAAQRAEFEGGGLIHVNRDVSLDDTVFGAPTTVRATTSPTGGARLVGLRNSQAGQLTLIGLDLRQCHFEGATGLDTLAVEGESDIWPHWKKRRIIADEEDIRRGICTHENSVPMRRKGEKPGRVRDSVHVSSCYRQLRKGLEVAKDFPGSADFYYGEMEMRRWRATSQDATSRALLWAYWFTSGYGLKAWRSLVSLVTIILLGGVALAIWGLHGAPPATPARFGDGLLTAVEFATLRDTSQQLSEAGRVLAIPLRLIAPLMFLQLIFALRSRIQR